MNLSKKQMTNIIIIALALLAFWALTKLRNPAVNFQEDAEGGIQFHKGTWAEAIAKAQKENKPIFMDIYATWCGPCKQLRKYTFADKGAGEFFNQNFINVALDGEQPEGADLAQKFEIMGYPTLIFFDKNGNVLQKSPGFRPPADLIKLGKSIKESMK